MLSSRPLTGVLLTGAVAMLGLGAVNILIVPLIVEDLMISETFFAVLEAAQVAGMVLAGIVVAVLASRFRPTTVITVAMAGVGAIISLMSQVGSWWHMSLVLFVVGLLITPLQASVSTLTQTLIPDEMRGRVGGALNALISAATVSVHGLRRSGRGIDRRPQCVHRCRHHHRRGRRHRSLHVPLGWRRQHGREDTRPSRGLTGRFPQGHIGLCGRGTTRNGHRRSRR